MFYAFKLAQRTMATWSGLSKTEAWPLIEEMITSSRLVKLDKSIGNGEKTGMIGFEFTRNTTARNPEYRSKIADNLSDFLTENGVSANTWNNHIIFNDYNDKNEVIEKLESFMPENDPSVNRHLKMKVANLENEIFKKDKAIESMELGLKSILKNK